MTNQQEDQGEKETLVPVQEEQNLAQDLESLVPKMNVNLPQQPLMEQIPCPVSDDMLMGIYGEIIDDIRKDREEISSYITAFVEMVINEGDSTTSSKEALVNLMKMKSDCPDKIAKVADLMTRVKLKEKDTFRPYMANNQTNTININTDKRDLLKQIEKHQKGKKKDAK